mgnify:CR=1 FL=1
MPEDALDELKLLDREALMEKMAAELPEIRTALKVTREALAERTGVDAAKIKACGFVCACKCSVTSGD